MSRLPIARLATALVCAFTMAGALAAAAPHDANVWDVVIREVRRTCSNEAATAFTAGGVFTPVSEQDQFITAQLSRTLANSAGRDSSFMERFADGMAKSSPRDALNVCIQGFMAVRRKALEADPKLRDDKDFAEGLRLIEGLKGGCTSERDLLARNTSEREFLEEGQYRVDQSALKYASTLARNPSPFAPDFEDIYVKCLFAKRRGDTLPIVKNFQVSCMGYLDTWKKTMPPGEDDLHKSNIENQLSLIQAAYKDDPADTRKTLREDLAGLTSPPVGATDRQRAAFAVTKCMLESALRTIGS